MNKLLVFIAIFCGTCNASANECNFELLLGEEFYFPKMPDEEMSKLGYILWSSEPKLNSSALPYDKYNGKKGKLTSEIIQDAHRIGSYQRAVLENCETVYAQSPQGTSKFNIVIYQRDIETAKKIIGRKVWVNQSNAVKPLELATKDKNIFYRLEDKEEVQIVGICLEKYGHIRGAGPFYLEVKKSTGETGLIAYSLKYIYLSKPPE